MNQEQSADANYAGVWGQRIGFGNKPALLMIDFMKGYTQYFGTPEQPLLPTRSVFQVAGLANPGFLVEIEITAVRR